MISTREPTRLDRNTFNFQASGGQNYIVELVFEGDRYGLDECLTFGESQHDMVRHGPLVQFNLESGYLVASYYAATLLGEDGHGSGESLRRGLSLDFGMSPTYDIDAASMEKVIDFIRRERIAFYRLQADIFNNERDCWGESLYLVTVTRDRLAEMLGEAIDMLDATACNSDCKCDRCAHIMSLGDELRGITE